MNMQSKNFTLRPFRPEDAENMYLNINTRKIEEDTTIPTPWPLDQIKWWIGFITEAAANYPVTEKHFVIEINGVFSGSVAIINIDGHKGEIGYWLKEDAYGKGIMTEVVKMVTDYAFNQMNMKRLFAPVLPHNKASVRVLEKNNYVKEGVLRKFYCKKGEYVDALCYAYVGGE